MNIDNVQPTAVLTLNTSTAIKIMQAVLPCVSKEQTRYYLNGVFVTIHNEHNVAGAVLRFVATDGHRMAVFEHDYIAEQATDIPFFESCIMPTDAALFISKLKTEKHLHSDAQTVRLILDGGKLTVQQLLGDTVQGSRAFALVDGTFPDYTRVMPNKPEQPTNHFNATYLADLCKAAKTVGGKRTTAISVYDGTYTGAPSWVVPDIEGLSYILMPMRGGDYITNFTAQQTDAQRFAALAAAVSGITGGDYETRQRAIDALRALAEGLSQGEVARAA